MATRNYYEILGVPYDAGTEQIQKAFLKLKADYNPDLYPSDSKQAKRFRHIRAAKRTLLDPAKRRKYDYLLVQEGILEVIPDWNVEAEPLAETGSSLSSGLSDSSLVEPSVPEPETFPTEISQPDAVTDFQLADRAERWRRLDADVETSAEETAASSAPTTAGNQEVPVTPPQEDPVGATHESPAISAATRTKQSESRSPAILLFQMLMLPFGAVAGISVAILVLWVGFQFDPFGLFDRPEKPVAQPVSQRPSETKPKQPSVDAERPDTDPPQLETETAPEAATEPMPENRATHNPVYVGHYQITHQDNPQFTCRIEIKPDGTFTSTEKPGHLETGQWQDTETGFRAVIQRGQYQLVNDFHKEGDQFRWEHVARHAETGSPINQSSGLARAIAQTTGESPMADRLSLPPNSPWRLLFNHLDQTGQTCAEFDWWPTNQDEADQLQKFVDNLVAIERGIARKPEDDPDVSFLARQRDRWATEFFRGFRPPDGRLADTESDLNRRYETTLKTGTGNFLAFGMLHLNPDADPASGHLTFKISGTEIQFQTTPADDWPAIDPGLHYVLIGEMTPDSLEPQDNPGNDEAEAGEPGPNDPRRVRIDFISRVGSPWPDPQARAETTPMVQLDQAKIDEARSILDTEYGARRKQLEREPWDFKEPANFLAKQSKMVELHREIYAFKDEEQDPNNQYAIIIYALEVAIEAGHWEEALAYIARLKADFPIDDLPLQIDAVKTWDKLIKNLVGQLRAEKRQELEKLVNQFANRAYADHRFDEAAELFELADKLIPSQDARKKAVHRMNLHSHDLAKKHASMMAIRDRLKNNNDPEQRLQLGKFWCFDVGDWPLGLPYLATGSDPKISAAAQLDLAGAQTREQRRAIADAWYELAQDLKGADEQGTGQRAVTLYRDLLLEETGLKLKETETRIERLMEKGISGPVDTGVDESNEAEQAGPADD
ncbi:MAG: J domain-containing protein [Mariniblastus sp.]|nr:J domain-containing protein [Mariniblastus sp.]